MRVLVVDDDAAICELFCRWLDQEGYCCRSAYTAAGALTDLVEETFDLMLLDINMPEKTGIEILKEVKERYPDLAVVMVTAVKEREVAFGALRLGADGYLNKPVNKLELTLIAANAIMRRRVERENRIRQEELARLVAERTTKLEEAYEDLKRSHNQILQQEKMAAIGQLAAGVAHEINNPTGFISSNLGTLEKYIERLAECLREEGEILAECAAPEPLARSHAIRKRLKIDYVVKDAAELINESREGTERIKKIVQGLKNFSRKDQDDCQLANINDCLESTLNIVWNELKYKATVRKELGELPLTACYPQQLNQVFMNLLVNASHAIEEKGEILIRTWHEQEVIHVSIADTGCGIPPENLERIFEPFFTTKEVGKGTGLGMSISADIIKKHHGGIVVDSEVGRGTTFTVTIPVTEKLCLVNG